MMSFVAGKDIEIIHVHGHVEVFKNNEFLFSADTVDEARKELEELT